MRYLILLLLLTACGSVPAIPPTPIPTTVPTASPAASTTPQPSAIPITPTSAATASVPAPTIAANNARLVQIPTTNNATVFAEQLGNGPTAVIFAVMGNCSPGWTQLAEAAADQGFWVLTYRWQACKGTRIDNQKIRLFVEDARAVIQYVREQGARKIILVGASLGGCASAALLAESQADGLIVIASPATIPAWDFQISAENLASPAPKLFITAEDDSVVPATATRALYELASEPRSWQTYPGTAHGTDLFTTEHGQALQEQILGFLQAIAST
jgi:uncharacterized protein